jgi:hypothetical protein
MYHFLDSFFSQILELLEKIYPHPKDQKLHQQGLGLISLKTEIKE